MFYKKAKRELLLLKAFQEIFLDENKKLKEAGKVVISYLRDEAGARGELGRGGVPYFYDGNNRFDEGAAGFLLGKRRMFDLVIKYLSWVILMQTSMQLERVLEFMKWPRKLIKM